MKLPLFQPISGRVVSMWSRRVSTPWSVIGLTRMAPNASDVLHAPLHAYLFFFCDVHTLLANRVNLRVWTRQLFWKRSQRSVCGNHANANLRAIRENTNVSGEGLGSMSPYSNAGSCLGCLESPKKAESNFGDIEPPIGVGAAASRNY
jgi:hypothetical protein